jgi:hypothetical protein
MPPARADAPPAPLPSAALPAAIALFGALAMSVVILWAVASGDGAAQLGALTSMPWGIVSLVDLYTGFTLFSLWIWFRERSQLAALAWTAAMMLLGFAAGRRVRACEV